MLVIKVNLRAMLGSPEEGTSQLMLNLRLQASGKVICKPKHGAQIFGLDEQLAKTVVGVIDDAIPGRNRGM